MLESGAGRSVLARKAINHFGIKCGDGWSGVVYYKRDDDYDSNGYLKESCFRSYPTSEDSFEDHSARYSQG
ncbi:MAG: glucosaminidase domain-containing protein [Phaeodactylibacter sp.]|nr:glucosaminidase domain-containing protein [Phaeodactylibacter sp.]